MSEQEVKKSLADQRVDKILAEMKSLNERLDKIAPQKVETPSKIEEKPPAHFDEKQLETDCPECKKKIEDFKAKVGMDFTRQVLKERKDAPLVCDGCEIGVRKEEENCPFCGSKSAHKR